MELERKDKTMDYLCEICGAVFQAESEEEAIEVQKECEEYF
jgi:hypothetical protein